MLKSRNSVNQKKASKPCNWFSRLFLSTKWTTHWRFLTLNQTQKLRPKETIWQKRTTLRQRRTRQCCTQYFQSLWRRIRRQLQFRNKRKSRRRLKCQCRWNKTRVKAKLRRKLLEMRAESSVKVRNSGNHKATISLWIHWNLKSTITTKKSNDIESDMMNAYYFLPKNSQPINNFHTKYIYPGH